MEKRTKESKKRLNSLILLIAFTAIMLIASTYAWFTTQKNVDIENLRGVVEVAEGLEISLDAKSWSQKINLGDVAAVDKADANETLLSILDNAYTDVSLGEEDTASHKNIDPIELLPVSSIGEHSKIDRLDMVRGKLENGNLGTIKLVDEKNDKYLRKNKATAISDPNLAYTSDDYPSFIAFDLFVKNTSRTANEGGDVLQLDVDSVVDVLDSALNVPPDNGYNRNGKIYVGKKESGLQNCVRVGFALYEPTSDPTADQKTALTDLVGKDDGKTIKDVAIWEPNANAHVEYIVNSNNKVATDAQNGTITVGGMLADSQFFTFGLKNTAVSQTIPEGSLYKWDSDVNEYLSKQQTVQTPAGAIKTNAVNLKSVSGDGSTDFKIASNKISRVRIYIWLEGQDPDCINFASFGGGIEVDLGLTKPDTTPKGP